MRGCHTVRHERELGTVALRESLILTPMSQPVINLFTWHRVLRAPAPLAVTVDCFRRQVDYICSRYRVLSGGELPAALRGELPANVPSAAIVMDDGWADSWINVTPILVERRIPAILALCTGFLHDGAVRCADDAAALSTDADASLKRAVYDGDSRAFLSRSEVKAMVATGVWSIQAHGHTHARRYARLNAMRGFYPSRDNWSLRYALDGEEPFAGAPCGDLASDLAIRRRSLHPELVARLKSGGDCAMVVKSFGEPLVSGETEEAFRSRVRRDLGGCRDEILRVVGVAPRMLFWPWGQYSVAALEEARGSGYEFTFTVEKGFVAPPAANDPLPRIGVAQGLAKLRRNAFTFRHPVLAGIRGAASPSPSCLVPS